MGRLEFQTHQEGTVFRICGMLVKGRDIGAMVVQEVRYGGNNTRFVITGDKEPGCRFRIHIQEAVPYVGESL
jgi:hypothetical protein